MPVYCARQSRRGMTLHSLKQILSSLRGDRLGNQICILMGGLQIVDQAVLCILVVACPNTKQVYTFKVRLLTTRRIIHLREFVKQ